MKKRNYSSILYLAVAILTSGTANQALASTTRSDPIASGKSTNLISIESGVSATAVGKLLADGDDAFAKQDWLRYQTIYMKLSQLSPKRGEYWYRLGLAYRALGKTDEAKQVFQNALNLGYRSGRSYFQLAKLAAAAGQKDVAVELFNKARSAGFVNSEQQLLEDPEFNIVLSDLWPKLSDDTSEALKWKTDIAFLAQRIEQSAYAETSLKTSVSTELRKLIDQPLNSEAKLFAMMRILRKLGSGHSQLYPPFQGQLAFHAAPVRLQFFADGLFVVAAKQPYHELVGHKVTKIGCLSTTEWRDAAAEILPHDGPSGLDFIASLMMVIPEYSRALGCDTPADQLLLTVQSTMATNSAQQGSQVQVSGKTLTIADLQQMLAVSLPDSSWQAVSRVRLPLSVALPGTNKTQLYRYSEVPESDIMYWQFNQLRDDPAQSLSEFLAELGQELKKKQSKGLILDLRHNNGGNGELVPEVIAMLQQHGYLDAAGKPSKLVVLTSGRTFSAAVLLAADLQAYNALFVGEPTGAGAVHIGEENLVLLPNTGLAVAVATRLFVRSDSDDKQPWIAPHLQLQTTFKQYQAGEDPALAAAIDLLKH